MDGYFIDGIFILLHASYNNVLNFLNISLLSPRRILLLSSLYISLKLLLGSIGYHKILSLTVLKLIALILELLILFIHYFQIKVIF